MRTVGLVRLGLGALLLTRPSLGPQLTGTPATSRVRLLSRVLGLRYLAQGAIDLTLRPDRRVDIAIEVVHALSMLPLARPGRPHARLALLSAGVAATLAAAETAGDAPGPDGLCRHTQDQVVLGLVHHGP